MDRFRVDVDAKTKIFWSVFLLMVFTQCVTVTANVEYSIVNSQASSDFKTDVVLLDHVRTRRAVELGAAKAPEPLAATTEAPLATAMAPTANSSSAPANNSSNATANSSTPTEAPMPLPTAVVTQIPLLGVNGSGILKVNFTENTPKVSDPIVPDDNFKDIFKETPERIQSEQNITNLTYDQHNFYNSTFIGNATYFNEYWANISNPGAQVHAVLSNSHRRATTLQLSFAFPFYGNYIHNITVATGGFIYTGEHVHNWLAATQYIAPLMANFDTSLTNDSLVKLYDDGEKFTAFWENVTLQENVNKTFTFAVTLYKTGEIVFAYKSIPTEVQNINDVDHPVKVGISDAYLNDNIMFYVRRKIIYEYHRVSFKNYYISNKTILRLVPQPTCLQYNTCEGCLNHNTAFNCTWCPQIQKCSSGTDRNKQDWKLRNCDRTTITEASACVVNKEDAAPGGNKTIYVTDNQQPAYHNTSVDNIPDSPSKPRAESVNASVAHVTAEPQQRSAVGGAIAGFLAVTLIVCFAAWILYAFKNPHTRSGQIIIKYRPSQWSWKRGEARYTAATIHM